MVKVEVRRRSVRPMTKEEDWEERGWLHGRTYYYQRITRKYNGIISLISVLISLGAILITALKGQ